MVGVGVNDTGGNVGVAVAVDDGVCVNIGVAVRVAVGVLVDDGAGVGENIIAGVLDAVSVGVNVGLGVGVNVAVRVTVLVTVGVGVMVRDAVGVGVLKSDCAASSYVAKISFSPTVNPFPASTSTEYVISVVATPPSIKLLIDRLNTTPSRIAKVTRSITYTVSPGLN